jgi:soluble lytic murein transglycosylase-like protein
VLYTLPSGALAAKGQTIASHKSGYNTIIKHAAKRYKVEAALIRAVIKVESNFNPKAVSRAGAVGLMQLMPTTAAAYGIDDSEALFDPAVNVDVGTRHLKRLLRKYKNISRALKAYNAGEGRDKRFRKTGVYLETRKYTVSVIKYYWRYKKR